MTALIPMLILYFFAIDLAIYFLGEEWLAAGEYCQILAPLGFFKIISSPLSNMFYIGSRQGLNLLFQSLMMLACFFSLTAATSAYEAVSNLSLTASFLYILNIIISAKIAKVY